MTMTQPPPIGRAAPAAVWSLVLGLLGIIMCCAAPVFGLPAVICGHIAQNRISRSRGTITGGGMATAGLIMGYLEVVFSALLLPMYLSIGVPAFVRVRAHAAEAVCATNLQRIAAAKEAYVYDHLGDEARRVEDLVPKYLDKVPQCPSGGSYSLGKPNEKPSCSRHSAPPAEAVEEEEKTEAEPEMPELEAPATNRRPSAPFT
jgi:hypothetical protein